MRVAAVVSVIAVGALVAGISRCLAAPSIPVVRCDEDIGHPRSGHESGYRVILGAVSAPPAYLRQVVATPGQPWPYWRKAGLVVWSDASITVSVPAAWRRRVAISWGNSTPVVSTLRFVPCTAYFGQKGWAAYAGGYYLRSRSACVPLIFRVGRRSATVHFGIGRVCTPRRFSA